MSGLDNLSVIILAAGKGTRMKSALPKVMHEIAGRPMIGWLLESVKKLEPDRVVVVVSDESGKELPELVSSFGGVVAIQKVRDGSGRAVSAALSRIDAGGGSGGDVLILLGDMPLISDRTLESLVKEKRKGNRIGLSVLAAEYDTPPAFGRMILNDDGTLNRIVEDSDCSAEQKKIRLCNLGAFCVDAGLLPKWIEGICNDNSQGEYYITDIPEIAARDGYKTAVVRVDAGSEVMGVNLKADLAGIEAVVQDRLRKKALDSGVTMIDPASVHLSWDTTFGRDVVIEPNVFFGTGVRVGDDVLIKAFSHIEGAEIGDGSTVGPFARLRPGAVLERRVGVGNFVEVKNSLLHDGVKAGHLSYLGDCEVGSNTNIGAGTITCNYDGYEKHKTSIGEGAFVGSHSTLVAPVSIQNGAYIAAGSVITKDVPADALSIARVRAVVYEGWAKSYRNRREKGEKEDG